MRLLHTSDWHLGQNLKGYDRHSEHQVFLDWLLKTLAECPIDALLIAGDIFDQANPGAAARALFSRALFYRFLAQARARRPQLDIVVIAGNHDSAARIDTPHAGLNELIGSANGNKFKTYAQQFTLKVLLDYANQHLSRLSTRYPLRRGNEPLSLLMIDADFADEVRSVHSLFGGESFLVSLALALGLASLSSERVRVESLFIDESFGSLDADTLKMAMEALDRLQSEGRRVSVISHVHDMAERIGVQIKGA